MSESRTSLKRWASEDNLLHKVHNEVADREVCDFWQLLYPEHPMIKLKPIWDCNSSEKIFCIHCEDAHTAENICL